MCGVLSEIRNFDDANKQEFFGSRAEGSAEISKEELRELIQELTSEIYSGNLEAVARRVKFLENTKTKVDLYHRIDNERAVATRAPLSDGSAAIKSSHVEGQYYGQGLYWGVNEPYCWVQESDLGACYILRDVPLDHVLPVQCAGQIMAVMPITEMFCDVELDETNRSSYHKYFDEIEETKNNGPRRLLYKQDIEKTRPIYSSKDGFEYDEDLPNAVYLDIVQNSLKDQTLASWWKAKIYLEQLATTPIPSKDIINKVYNILGIEMVEVVREDEELICPYYRIYVKETSPILCMAIAAAAHLPELVFGANPKIKEMKEFAIEENRVIRF